MQDHCLNALYLLEFHRFEHLIFTLVLVKMNQPKFIYRTTALLMAFLMFFTSVGFSIDMHFCRGQLKSVNLLGKAKSCHVVGAAMKNCPHHQQAQTAVNKTIKKKDCCENQLKYFHLDQDQQQNTASFSLSSLSSLQFIVVNLSTYSSTSFSNQEVTTDHLYKPPVLFRDIPVLFANFLL